MFLNDWAGEHSYNEWVTADDGTRQYVALPCSPLEQIRRDFEITDEELAGVEILLASYSYEDYSGNAFVLFRKEDQLYEVNGGHCSCYGLEGQWEPEATSVGALKMRINGHWYGSDEFGEELTALLDTLAVDGIAATTS